jgi:extracellular factor (EF) 3-hydroxypalmitic acid methyl ester biosynthesis protein
MMLKNNLALKESSPSASRDAGSAPMPPPPASGPRSYQDLDGGFGKEVNFRPARYPSAELGPIGTIVSVETEQGIHLCQLHDVSQNGVAFEWNGGPLEVGDTIPTLTVSFDRHDAYRGAAVVGSVREVGTKKLVGASFIDMLMNIDDVLHLRDVKMWSGPGLALKNRPWRVSGHEKFKSLVADLRLLFQDAEQQLGELEASLPWHVVHGDQDLPARNALIDRVRTEVVSEMLSVFLAIGDLKDPLSPAEHQALKEFSLRNLHEFLIRSPWLRRAKEKPLGYPGDYELMNGIYGHGIYGNFSGTTLFAKAMSMLLVEAPSATSVVERKNLIRQRLSTLLDEGRPKGRPIRVLSIAAGPAQEIYELLDRRESIPHPVEIVLFDQDKRALGFAYGRLKKLVVKKWGKQVRIVYLHDTIKRLLRDERLFETFGEFDTIFSCGLFDYLPEPTAVTLTRSLFSNLAPGGQLYIGNQTLRTPSRWVMEYHCDWYLIYRQHADMLSFARAGAPSAEISIEEEPTGINPFVRLTRPTSG